MSRVKFLPVKVGEEIGISVYPNFSASGNVYGMKHKVYGKISAPLNIHSKNHVEKFLDGVRNGNSVELMSLTGGKHFHTVMADKKEILDNVEKALKEGGFLA